MKYLQENKLAKELLEQAGLPTSDLDRCSSLKIYSEEREGKICGTVGYELYGDDILLRSLAVDPLCRGEGLGKKLVAYAENMAVSDGAKTAWLLTTTARDFFHRHGYTLIDRDSAPESIRATSQFSSLCPASSAFMCKRLVT